MLRTSSTAATMPSSQKWLAVATTTNTVSTGWASTHQRCRLELTRSTAQAISNAQPTCTDGIAAS